MNTTERTYVELVAEYAKKRPTLAASVVKAEPFLRSIMAASDPAEALAIVLLGVRDGAIDFAIDSIREVLPGHQTLIDCFTEAKYKP